MDLQQLEDDVRRCEAGVEAARLAYLDNDKVLTQKFGLHSDKYKVDNDESRRLKARNAQLARGLDRREHEANLATQRLRDARRAREQLAAKRAREAARNAGPPTVGGPASGSPAVAGTSQSTGLSARSWLVLGLIALVVMVATMQIWLLTLYYALAYGGPLAFAAGVVLLVRAVRRRDARWVGTGSRLVVAGLYCPVAWWVLANDTTMGFFQFHGLNLGLLVALASAGLLGRFMLRCSSWPTPVKGSRAGAPAPSAPV